MREPPGETSRGTPGVRDRVSRAAMNLFVRKGFARTGVREIAAASEVSVGSIFNYFASKEDILYGLISQMQDNVAPMIQAAADTCRSCADDPAQSVETSLLALIDEYAVAVDTWHDHIVLSYQESRWLPREQIRGVTEIERRMRDSLAEILRAGVERGEFTAGDLRFRAHLIQTLLQSWAIRRWALEDLEDLDAFLPKARRAVLAVLRAPPTGAG
jgi:AcrR family transcriptional regulator